MSFSSEVKEELTEYLPRGRHCQIAELAAIIVLCGRVRITETGKYRLFIHTENIYTVRKYYTLLEKIFGITGEVSICRNIAKKTLVYTILVKNNPAAEVLAGIKFLNKDGNIREDYSLVSNLIVQNNCCKKSFIRGAFLAAGSIGDPEKSYHFEIVVTEKAQAEEMIAILSALDIKAKLVKRKNHYPVYIKESDALAEFLGITEAHISLMKFENVRIYKEVKNKVNRKVNCETANIKKTASAAAKQLDDIYYLKNINKLDKLPTGLRELAKLRMEYPDATLKELGELLSEPLGKSGVNHRLNKISRIAEENRT
nr:DNA-binding protein WhiA [uncultured Catonella sp.]